MIKKRLLANLHGVKKCKAVDFFDVSKQESFQVAIVLFMPGRAIHHGSSKPAEVEQTQIRTAFGDGGRSVFPSTWHKPSGKNNGFGAGRS
jgi:hypothetical protein